MAQKIYADVNITGNTNSESFVKNGGTSSQFLKADGTVDNNIYVTSGDLPSTLTLYATTASAGISTYTKLVTTIDDPYYNTIAVDVSTGVITTVDQPCGALISPANLISGNPGVFNVTTVGNIRKVSGSGQAEFYFKVYKRTSAGVETLIGTSAATLPVTNGGYSEFSAMAVWNDGTFTTADYVVIKYFANRISGGSNPTYNFQFGGTIPVRTIVPVPTAVIPNIFLYQLADVEDVPALNNEILYWNTSASLWEHALVDELIGFTPYNATNPSNFIPLTALSSTATGLTYTNTTGVFSLTSGYSIPTTSKQTQWDTAYTNRVTSLTTTGSSGASTLSFNVLNVPNYTLAGLNGQPAFSTSLTGLVKSTLGIITYVTDQSTEWNAAYTDRYKWDGGVIVSPGTALTGRSSLGASTVGGNIFISTNPSAITFLRANADNTVSWLNAVDFRTAIGAGTSSATGTVLSVAALALTTTGTDLSSSVINSSTNPVITLNVPTASATNRGALSSTDWSTFNGKQSALINPITGSLTSGFVPKAATATTLTNSIIYDDGTNVSVGGGGSLAASKLQVWGDLSVGDDSIAGSYVNVVAAGSTTAGIRMGSETSKNSRAAIYTSLTNTNLTIEVAAVAAATFDGATRNLGIGTTTLTEKLNVAGNGAFTNGAASVQIYATSGGVSPILFMNSVSNNPGDFRSNSGGFKWTLGSISAASSTPMSLTGASNLLIGSTTDYANSTVLQATGNTLTTGVVYKNQAAPTAKTTAVTLTGAEILVGIVTVTSAAAVSITIPTGPSLDLSFFPTLSAGSTPARASFDWSIMNLGSATGIVTVVSNAGNGNQLFGQTTIQIPSGVSPAAAIFRTIKTGIGTYQTYRIT